MKWNWLTVLAVGLLLAADAPTEDAARKELKRLQGARALAMDRPLLMSVDERPYPERLNYQSFDFSEQLALLTALRRHLVRILRMQPPEAWQRVGVHSESGLVSVRQLVFQSVRHLRHHLPFIAEKRAAMSALS